MLSDKDIKIINFLIEVIEDDGYPCWIEDNGKKDCISCPIRYDEHRCFPPECIKQATQKLKKYTDEDLIWKCQK